MQSMTGYGRRQVSLDGREITVELKTVNHRFLDVSCRLPRPLSFSEDTLRKQLCQASPGPRGCECDLFEPAPGRQGSAGG